MVASAIAEEARVAAVESLAVSIARVAAALRRRFAVAPPMNRSVVVRDHGGGRLAHASEASAADRIRRCELRSSMRAVG